MSVQKFHGTINTDGIKDERGIETPSLSATGEVSGQTGVFTESVTAPSLSGNLTGNVTGDVTGDLTGTAAKATADAEGNVIPTTYATKDELAAETSARETADETLSGGITAEATARAQEISALQTGLTGGTITVAEATHAASADNATNATTATNATNATTAATANTLAESGKYTLLWSGNWDGSSSISVTGILEYTQIIVQQKGLSDTDQLRTDLYTKITTGASIRPVVNTAIFVSATSFLLESGGGALISWDCINVEGASCEHVSRGITVGSNGVRYTKGQSSSIVTAIYGVETTRL